MMPRNRFSLFAALWFGLMWYALLRESSGTSVPPFAHFDKFMHALLFFAQFWLLARAFLQEERQPPYRLLAIGALLFAVSSEVAQLLLTQTRQAEAADALADLAGAAAALWLARQTALSRRI